MSTPTETNPNSNTNVNVGKLGKLGSLGMEKKGSQALECPKSPGRLIKSPKTGDSKFVSAGIINKSPSMQGKSPNFEKKEGNVLDKLSSKKKASSMITVSAPKEDKEDIQTGKFPVRRNMGNVQGSCLKDKIQAVPQQQNISDILDSMEEKASTPLLDNENPENNYEGYLYKLTKTKKLKKMYFRLIHKDMYCK